MRTLLHVLKITVKLYNFLGKELPSVSPLVYSELDSQNKFLVGGGDARLTILQNKDRCCQERADDPF